MLKNHLLFWTVGIFVTLCCQTSIALAQPSSTSDQSHQSVTSNSHQLCLFDPIATSFKKPFVGEKAKKASKGVLGSILGAASGGVIGSGGQKEKLAKRPAWSKSLIKSQDRKLAIELQARRTDKSLTVAVRLKKDSNKGAPHLLALQNASCHTLLPKDIRVFDRWGESSFRLSWSHSQNGEVTQQQTQTWDSSWADFTKIYPQAKDIPGIWHDLGGSPFKGIRGVIAEFEFPKDEEFNPEDWYLVAHTTRPGDSDNSLVTQPFVTSMQQGRKQTFEFSAAEPTTILPATTSPNLSFPRSHSVTGAVPISALVGAGLASQAVASKNPCDKIREEIKKLEQCTEGDCEEEKQALKKAQQALEDAIDALQDAKNAQANAQGQLTQAQNKLDQTRDKAKKANARLARLKEQYRRLSRSLMSNADGLNSAQVLRAMNSMREAVNRAKAEAAKANAAAEAAQNQVNEAEAALAAANAAVAEAREDAKDKEKARDDARKTYEDCLAEHHRKCEELSELWRQYDECKDKQEELEEAADSLDTAADLAQSSEGKMNEDAQDFEESQQQLDEANQELEGMGGDSSGSSSESTAAKAKNKKHEAERLAKEAEEKLREAERKLNNGDAEGATDDAADAWELQQQAEEAMDDAADKMEDAALEADRARQEELRRQAEKAKREAAAAASVARLKKSACIKYIDEYFGPPGNDSIRDALEGLVEMAAENIPKGSKRLEELKKQKEQLEKLLSLLDGILNNDSLESRNASFQTALDIAKELSGKVPGLEAFFNFYAKAYEASMAAIKDIQKNILANHRLLADEAIRKIMCCSYSPEELSGKNLETIMDEAWDKFIYRNEILLGSLNGENLKYLENYFKSQLRVHWIECCLEFTLANS